jgi:hypothetical protein
MCMVCHDYCIQNNIWICLQFIRKLPFLLNVTSLFRLLKFLFATSLLACIATESGLFDYKQFKEISYICYTCVYWQRTVFWLCVHAALWGHRWDNWINMSRINLCKEI